MGKVKSHVNSKIIDTFPQKMNTPIHHFPIFSVMKIFTPPVHDVGMKDDRYTKYDVRWSILLISYILVCMKVCVGGMVTYCLSVVIV